MGIIKSVMGFGGMDRVGNRIVLEAEERRRRGELEDFWFGYNQNDIGIRASITSAGGYIALKLRRAGLQIVSSEGGGYGRPVRLLIQFADTRQH
jgi:hypothetical protein